MNNKFGRPKSTRGHATRSRSASGKDSSETRREPRFDSTRPPRSRSASGKDSSETRREKRFDSTRPPRSRSASGKDSSETRREKRFDSPRPPRSRSTSGKDSSETRRETRFDSTRPPRSRSTSGKDSSEAHRETRFDSPRPSRSRSTSGKDSSEARRETRFGSPRPPRSRSASGKDSSEARREPRFDSPRPSRSRSASGKDSSETRRETRFDSPRPSRSRSTSGKDSSETRREPRFDSPRPPRSRSTSGKDSSEAHRETRFDSPRPPRSQSRGKGFTAYKKTSRAGSDSRVEKPGFKKPFTKKTTENSEARGFRGKPHDTDRVFSRGKGYEPRDQKESRRGLDDKRGLAKERTGEKRYQSPTKRSYDTERTFESKERETTSKRERFPSERPSRWQERKSDRYSAPKRSQEPFDESIRLNKFIANSGVCSRREADNLIATGAITVNGEIVNELGSKIKTTDKVFFGKQKLVNEKKVYILLNKPKNYITTSDDPMERKTVLDLIKNACRERVFSVGRLDRNTTGLLLLTNDGDLAKKLTHPRHSVVKLYQVSLDKALSAKDMEEISKGVKIDDLLVVPDEISYVDKAENRKEIGVAIHSGQNRVVRRMFEHFGYNVEKLDRVVFAGLTKKDLPRGKWRFLTSREVGFLKMIK